MLSAVLTSEARERCETTHTHIHRPVHFFCDFMLCVCVCVVNRIALVKPEKARQVEDALLRAAQMRQLGGRVSEEQLIGMLEQYNEKSEQKSKITVLYISLFFPPPLSLSLSLTHTHTHTHAYM